MYACLQGILLVDHAHHLSLNGNCTYANKSMLLFGFWEPRYIVRVYVMPVKTRWTHVLACLDRELHMRQIIRVGPIHGIFPVFLAGTCPDRSTVYLHDSGHPTTTHYNVYCIQYTTMYNAYTTLQCTMHTIHCNVYCIQFTAMYTAYNTQYCILPYNTQYCILHTIHYNV